MTDSSCFDVNPTGDRNQVIRLWADSPGIAEFKLQISDQGNSTDGAGFARVFIQDRFGRNSHPASKANGFAAGWCDEESSHRRAGHLALLTAAPS